MPFRDLHSNVKVRLLENFISRFIGSMIFPFMVVYLSIHFGTKASGILLVINVIAGLIVNLLSGYLSDHYGRKKIITISEITRFFSFIVMSICNSPWISAPIITFFAMMLNSLCWGLTGPANEAMLIDVSTEHQRKAIYTIMYWSSNLSVAIGGVLGAFLFEKHLFQLFLLTTFFSFLVVILVTLFISESYLPKNESISIKSHITKMLTNYKFVVKDVRFMFFILGSITILSSEYQLTNYISMRLSITMPVQHFLFTDIDGIKALGILKSENTILVVLLMFFVQKIISKFDNRKILLLSSVLFVLGYSVMSYVENIYMLLIMMLVATIGEVIFGPLEQTYIVSMPPDKYRSSYMAFVGFKINLSLFIASITVLISSVVSPLSITISILLFGLLGTLIYSVILPNGEKTA
jgi:DHA1 family multidrug resistance protein B-like MFS transporter